MVPSIYYSYILQEVGTKNLRVKGVVGWERVGTASRAYARVLGLGLKPPLELDILQKLYYLRKEIKRFRILSKFQGAL